MEEAVSRSQDLEALLGDLLPQARALLEADPSHLAKIRTQHAVAVRSGCACFSQLIPALSKFLTLRHTVTSQRYYRPVGLQNKMILPLLFDLDTGARKPHRMCAMAIFDLSSTRCDFLLLFFFFFTERPNPRAALDLIRSLSTPNRIRKMHSRR